MMNYGCHADFIECAFDSIQNNEITFEVAYPYNAEKRKCVVNIVDVESLICEGGATIVGGNTEGAVIVNVREGVSGVELNGGDRPLLLRLLYTKERNKWSAAAWRVRWCALSITGFGIHHHRALRAATNDGHLPLVYQQLNIKNLPTFGDCRRNGFVNPIKNQDNAV
ncbi:hypothetical protein KSP39_PZI001138 [Platanthera zijinensis]|uniref:Uncharacterized protein n=1 Tax=Platanthera zijinensis TaxID=2320716 RepID=A0AAP0C0H3_9ASPA